MLTAFQFVISQVLLIAALVVIKQVDHFTTLPLGFNQNAVLIADVPEIKTSTLSTLKNQLPESPANKDATFSLNTPAAKINKWWAELKHQSFGDEQQGTEVKFVDSAYFRMVEIKLIAVTLNMWSYDWGRSIVVARDLTKLIGAKEPSQAIGEHIKTGTTMQRSLALPRTPRRVVSRGSSPCHPDVRSHHVSKGRQRKLVIGKFWEQRSQA